MPDAWRLDNAKWTAQSFSGAGAALAGGRWNPVGVHVVYASRHLATAVLEKFIHLPKPVPAKMGFVQYEIDFGGAAVERPARAALPVNWRDEPVPVASQQFGLEWYRRGRTAILAVPSAIVPDEENYVLNPAHPDFKHVKVSKPVKFVFDPRLAGLKGTQPAGDRR